MNRKSESVGLMQGHCKHHPCDPCRRGDCRLETSPVGLNDRSCPVVWAKLKSMASNILSSRPFNPNAESPPRISTNCRKPLMCVVNASASLQKASYCAMVAMVAIMESLVERHSFIAWIAMSFSWKRSTTCACAAIEDRKSDAAKSRTAWSNARSVMTKGIHTDLKRVIVDASSDCSTSLAVNTRSVLRACQYIMNKKEKDWGLTVL